LRTLDVTVNAAVCHFYRIQPRYGPDVEIDDTDSVITISDHKAYGTHDNHFLTLGGSEDYDIDESAFNSEDGVVEYLYDESGCEFEPLDDQRIRKHSVKRMKLEDTSQLSQLNTRHGRNMKSGSSNSNSTYRTENVDEFIKLIHSPREEPSTVTIEQCDPMLQKCDHLTGIDPDEMFFRSIVPDVKLLNQRDKGAFKLKVQQMLYDMLYPPKKSEQDTAIQNSP